MPKDHITRRYEGHDDRDILEKVSEKLEPFCEKYALKKEIDPQELMLKVRRTGVKGDINVRDGVVDVDLDYSFLIPSSVRTIARERIEAALDDLYPE